MKRPTFLRQTSAFLRSCTSSNSGGYPSNCHGSEERLDFCVTRTRYMASSIRILSAQGTTIILRAFRAEDADVSKRLEKLVAVTDLWQLNPIVQCGDETFFFVPHGDLIAISVVATADKNVNAIMVVSFLHRFVTVLVNYFKQLTEESVRDNFVTIYELLDEMMDFGFPQTTEPQRLREILTQQASRFEKRPISNLPILTGVVFEGRTAGPVYKKNEVFVNVVERAHLLVSSSGQILSYGVSGAIHMKPLLSGVPECRLGIASAAHFTRAFEGTDSANGSTHVDNVQFHLCVKLTSLKEAAPSVDTLSFVPPDEEFDLMTYSLSLQTPPPIWITHAVKSSERKREYLIQARPQFGSRGRAKNVRILIPVPSDTISPVWRVSDGAVRYVPEDNAVEWTVERFRSATATLRLCVSVPSASVCEPVSKRPISVQFLIEGTTASGVQVKYLRVFERRGYQASSWVRYLTSAGDYEFKV